MIHARGSVTAERLDAVDAELRPPTVDWSIWYPIGTQIDQQAARRSLGRRLRLGLVPRLGRDLGGAARSALGRRPHELSEQRRRAIGARLELGMELGRHEERVDVARKLGHLDQPVVRRRARAHEPGGLEPLAQEVVDLVAVAVALVDDRLPVDLAY